MQETEFSERNKKIFQKILTILYPYGRINELIYDNISFYLIKQRKIMRFREKKARFFAIIIYFGHYAIIAL